MSQFLPESQQTDGQIRTPTKGPDAFLSRDEETFLARMLSHPESFPPQFKSWLIEYQSLNGLPIPFSQVRGGQSGAWESYTPTWASTGTQPVLGNGTKQGRWARIGKIALVNIFLSAGTTTTFGTGTWSFSLPSTSVSGTIASGTGRVYDSSAGLPYVVGLTADTTGIFPFTNGAFFTNSSPITWATSDNLVLSFTYEAT